MTPSNRSSLATASGVPPSLAIRSAITVACRTASETGAARNAACAPRGSRGLRPRHRCATAGPCCRLRQTRRSRRPHPCGSRPRRASMPLIRVCAENGTNLALSGAISRPRSPYFSLARTTIERPSGVSSESEASCAASASSPSSTPGSVMNSVAWRLPSVIVPVLSRSKVSTSPAASTARPDMASTLKRTSRSMPAMPIADNSAPIVVGIRRNEQRDEDDDRHRAPCVRGKARDCDGGEDEDQRHAGEQDVERDLVRRLLPHRAFDERNHAVEKSRALRRGDPHPEPVRRDARAAGDRRAVAAALADDRRRFPGDRRLVDRGDAFDHLAVARDQVAGLDQHEIARFERGRIDELEVARLGGRQALGLGLGPGPAQRLGLRLAAPFGDCFGEIGEQHGEPQPDGDLPREQRAGADDRAAADEQIAQEKDRGQHRDDLDAEHDRVLDQGARIELAERRPDRRHDQRAVEDRKRPQLALVRARLSGEPIMIGEMSVILNFLFTRHPRGSGGPGLPLARNRGQPRSSRVPGFPLSRG